MAALSRTAIVTLALLAGGCSFLDDPRWPVLRPLDAEIEAEAAPEGGAVAPEAPPAETPEVPDLGAPTLDAAMFQHAATAATARLTVYREQLDDLAERFERGLADIDLGAIDSNEAWTTAQLHVSRLISLRNELSRLYDTAARDAARLLQLSLDADRAEAAGSARAEAASLTSLHRDLAIFLDHAEERQRQFKTDLAVVQARLAETPFSEPRERPDSAEDRPALTIAASAAPEEFRPALITLVETAEAAAPGAIYEVVAADDPAATERARQLLSLLGSIGVPEPRRQISIDRQAPEGSLRVYVK